MMDTHHTRLPRSFVLLLFLFFLALYTLFFSGIATSTDERQMTSVTRSIIDRFSLRFPEVDGLTTTGYGVGQSLVGIPFYLVHKVLVSAFGADYLPSYIFFEHLANPCVVALVMVYFFLLCFSLVNNAKSALLATFIFGLSTVLFPYSRTFFSEPLSALCFLAACYHIRRSKDTGVKQITLAGVWLGFGVLTRVSSLLWYPLYCAWVYSNMSQEARKDIRRIITNLLILVIPGIVAFVITLLQNYYLRGSLFRSGYAGSGFSTNLFTGVYGMLFSSGRGVFIYNPVLFVSLFFFPHFLKKEKLLGTFAVVFSIVAVVLYGKFWTWHAGWTFGSRFLIPALPFLALPLVFFVDSFRDLTPVRKIVALCIIGGSIFIQVQHAAVDPLEYNQELKNFILPQESPLFFYPQLSTIHGAGYLIEDGKTTLFISGVIGGWVSQWYLLFYVFFLFVLGWTFRRLCRITLVTLNFKEWYKNSKDWLQGNQIIVVWIVVCILVLCCAYMVRTPRGLACTEREAGTICVERIAKHLRMLQPPSPVGYSCYLQGYLEAPIDGTYQFHLKVNGTYRIMLGGEALFFNDKDIARHLQTNRVDMTQALYPVEIFYESFPERDVVASLYWTLPGEGKLFQPVETEYLYLVKPSGVQKTGDQLWRHWWLIVIVGILPLCVVEFKKRDEAASSID